ncbi:MAG: GTPase ObgE [Bdellovibrionales bacterium]|nr:GTPase ObgE [Bdellovibrionales bacterium]
MFHYKDQIVLTCISGSGGSGAVSFCRTGTMARGGPDGGDGGAGGDIIFSSTNSLKDFSHFYRKKRWKAESGKSGQGGLKTGAKGEDRIISIPFGTVLRDEQTNILMDFKKPQSLVLLKGGKGGRGNAWFKNSLNQAPRQFHKGVIGQEKRVILEFKPLIKVGLIGHANAGKSTFFNTMSGARSPVADYPYTTLRPYYGRIKDLSSEDLLMDIPGISRGSHQSIEKGLSFLRSLQRAKLLLHFVDSTSQDPLVAKQEIEEELEAFDKKFSDKEFSGLSKKKRWIVFTKIDLLQERSFLNQIDKNSFRIFILSNKSGEGVRELTVAIKKALSD